MYETTDSCFQYLFEKVQKAWNCRYKESFTPDNIQARSRAMYLLGFQTNLILVFRLRLLINQNFIWGMQQLMVTCQEVLHQLRM